MNFTEKQLHCIDCKKIFTFSIEEQQYHASQGFPNSPNCCPPCRKTRKSGVASRENHDEDSSPHSKMFPVNCTQCGKATRIPFQPRQNEPVYCGDCYIKTRPGKQDLSVSRYHRGG